MARPSCSQAFGFANFVIADSRCNALKAIPLSSRGLTPCESNIAYSNVGNWKMSRALNVATTGLLGCSNCTSSSRCPRSQTWYDREGTFNMPSSPWRRGVYFCGPSRALPRHVGCPHFHRRPSNSAHSVSYPDIVTKRWGVIGQS